MSKRENPKHKMNKQARLQDGRKQRKIKTLTNMKNNPLST